MLAILSIFVEQTQQNRAWKLLPFLEWCKPSTISSRAALGDGRFCKATLAPSSLHGLSGTRWADRVASVRLFAAHLPGIKVALQQLLALKLTPKTTIDVKGAIRYVSS